MAGEVPMSVKRLVATVDVASMNVSAFCREHGIGRTQFYEIRRRFETQGESGLEPRSRAPKSIANKTPIWIEDQIVLLRKQLDEEGLDAGPETISWHLGQQMDASLVPSRTTIWRILRDRGLVVEDPSKRPGKVWQRFEADRANELFQIDGTNHDLSNGDTVKIINVIDDGSRFCAASRAHPAESFTAAFTTLMTAFSSIGMCARLLSDNSKAFIKLNGPLAALGITKIESTPFHPQTCGKVERFHQTQAKWLRSRPQPDTLEQLQELLDEFTTIYNYRRPHRSIGRRTPAEQWENMAKSGPTDRPLQTNTKTEWHQTKVASNGALPVKTYAISLGAEHAHQTADTIITGNNCDVFINGQHIRHLTIDPNTRVQPLHKTPGRPRKTKP